MKESSKDVQFEVFDAFHQMAEDEKQQAVQFLHRHLERFGDEASAIHKAIDYALKDIPSFGGFVLKGSLENKAIGYVVVNATGMGGYIPENILVYIATDAELRGKGLGKSLLQKTFALAHGDIALHVEPDNPAKRLYEREGFTNKYLEMRRSHKA